MMMMMMIKWSINQSVNIRLLTKWQNALAYTYKNDVQCFNVHLKADYKRA